jgi:hypothetical protein
MKKLLTIFFFLLSASFCLAQELPAAYRAYKEKYPEGPPLNHRDSIDLMKIPEKIMPANLRGDPLPPVVDNSTLAFLRPVFMQVGASCGQAALIGYNFTYEMAYKRHQPAQYPMTQYPTHFAWNFQNGGDGWYGVSYFHSIEILRKCGTMNSYDYGGFYDDGIRWINGYDLYYNGMYNRVKGVFGIKTNTEEGILALKHWLYDHMGEGDFGGVASYYANTPWNANFLNDTTPEGGKYVMTAWFPLASHAMTIVGYNDSIRWDYNGDGQYTNDIDLNGDGIIDPRDWEIGGVKFVNSHGMAQDSGFCYMMYKCLAETFENGGIWNQEVHILDIDENYQPLITYKVTLTHNYRGRLKVLAGVSQDTTDISPAWMMDFPIMDYQGGNHYLQGQDTAEYLKSLEFGLDITPLLSNLQPGEPAKFFFIVDENDPNDEGEGEITAFSVMDYTNGEQEISSAETPVILENNSRTFASVVYVPEYDIVEITTDTLPPFSPGESYNYQLQADGGTPPYSWNPQYHYFVEQSADSFPEINGNQVLYTPATDTIMPVPLGFSFPYYGELYDTVYMHIDGFLEFSDDQLPWPYLQEPELFFRSERIIAPLTYGPVTIVPAEGDGGWAEINDTSATFRWKLSLISNPGMTDLNFAVRLTHNGNIEFIMGASTLEGIPWLSGISAGNNKDFIISPVSGLNYVPPGKKISFYYSPFPSQLNLSSNGLLTGSFENDDLIYDISCRATDRSGLTASKTLQLTSGPYIYFTVHDNGDDQAGFGDTVRLDAEIRNGSADTLYNSSLQLMTDDAFIEMQDSLCLPGNILPGQSVTVPEAFNFIVSVDVPDQRDLLFHATLASSEKNWHKDLIFKAIAPDIQMKQIIDSENGKLDPGETAPMEVTLQNAGHAAVEGVTAGLVSLDPEVQVLENPVQDFGTIGKGISVTRSYILQADDSTPQGFIAHFLLSTGTLPGLQRQDSIKILIGRAPVLVIDMDPYYHSGPGILRELNELNVISDYDYTISPKIYDYQSLFICLGYQNSSHALTLVEGTKLEEYLDNGGRIYMEGRKTWIDDPPTPVRPKFFLHSVGGTSNFYDTLTGIEGTFTQGLYLHNECYVPWSLYYLEPEPPAFAILQSQENMKVCGVAYDAGTYKTIGVMFEYGTLSDISPNATRDLMINYLEFFDIPVNPAGIDEKKQESFDVTVYPNPASLQLTVDSRQLAACPEGEARRISGQRPAVELVIIDLFGRELKEFNNIKSFPLLINISDLSPGMYIIRILSDDGRSGSVKFLKIAE